jgi:flavin-dependent dehydrogenase
MRIISPGGIELEINEKGYVVDREKFDWFYLNKSDADVEWECDVKHLLIEEGRVRGVEVDKDGNSKEVRADTVVLACGLNSHLPDEASLSPIRYPSDIAWAMEAVVEGENIGEGEYFEYFVGSVAPGWKATFSPLGGDFASAGVYVRRVGNPSDFFSRHMERLRKAKGNMKIVEVFEGGDPIAAMPWKLVGDGVVVCGGAGAQSGIMYGMRAGVIVAESIAQGDLSLYQKRWERELMREYKLGRKALNMLMEMEDEDIDRFARALSDFDFSSLRGNPYLKAFRVFMHILKKDPALILRLI